MKITISGFPARLVSRPARVVVVGALAVAAVFATSAFAGTIMGTAKNDTLRGTAGADKLYGRSGNDTLFGLGGSDYLNGGAGKDRFVCGAGRDTVFAKKGESVSTRLRGRATLGLDADTAKPTGASHASGLRRRLTSGRHCHRLRRPPPAREGRLVRWLRGHRRQRELRRRGRRPGLLAVQVQLRGRLPAAGTA